MQGYLNAYSGITELPAAARCDDGGGRPPQWRSGDAAGDGDPAAGGGIVGSGIDTNGRTGVNP